MPQKFGHAGFGNQQHAAETPDVRVAKFHAVVEGKKAVRMRLDRVTRTAYGQLPGHSEMDDEVQARTGVGCSACGTLRGLQSSANEFAQPNYFRDPPSGQLVGQ